MPQLYFNPQNPLVDGNKASRPFVRFLDALVKAIGTTGGPVLPGPITTAGLTMATNRLLGRTSAGTGNPQEISVNSSLTLSGGVLSVTTPATNLVQRATVTLTNAQIKALPTTGITLAASPGSGFWYDVLAVGYSADTSAGAYTNIDATYADLRVAYGAGTDAAGGLLVDDAGSTPVLTQITDVLGTAAQTVVPALRYAAGYTPGSGPLAVLPAPVLRSVVNNAALTLTLDNNGSGDLTGGNAANTLKVTVLYAVEAI